MDHDQITEQERAKIIEEIMKIEPLHMSGCGLDLYLRRADVLKVIKGVNTENKVQKLNFFWVMCGNLTEAAQRINEGLKNRNIPAQNVVCITYDTQSNPPTPQAVWFIE